MATKLFFSNNIHEIVDILLFLPNALAALKAMLVIGRRQPILDLFDMLRKLELLQITNDKFAHSLQLGIRQSQLFIYLICAVYYTSCLCDYVAAVTNADRILLWASWFPFDPTATLSAYHMVLVYQTVSTIYLASIHQTIDSFGGSVYCLLGGQLDVLGQRMTAIGNRNTPRSSKEWKTANEQKKDYARLLKDCLDTHHLCVKCVSCYIMS